MGGRDEDESSFVPTKGPHPMGDADVQIELTKLKERMAVQRKEIDDHREQFKETETTLEAIKERVTSLEKKLIFACGAAAGGGGIVGSVLGQLFEAIKG